MAVLLPPENYDDWLDPDRKRGQLDLLKTSAFHRDGALEYFPISTLVNNPAYDGPDCVEPASEEELKAHARASAQMDLGI
jgi:putative SOS response-associated peptidase YedK